MIIIFYSLSFYGKMKINGLETKLQIANDVYIISS